MKTHDLKTDPAVFDEVAAGRKTYELRKDDRGFEVGDTLRLQKTRYTGAQMASGKPLEYTGEEEGRIITHILKGPIYGLAEKWAILSLRPSRSTCSTDANPYYWKHGEDDPRCNCEWASVWSAWPLECQNCMKTLQDTPFLNEITEALDAEPQPQSGAGATQPRPVKIPDTSHFKPDTDCRGW